MKPAKSSHALLPGIIAAALFASVSVWADVLCTGITLKKTSEDTTVEFVHLKISPPARAEHPAATTEITLSNLVKPSDDEPKIWTNPAKTILGYTTDYVRENYQINLIWCTASGQCLIDQYLNNRLMNLLIDNKVKQAEGSLWPILFYLDGLKDDTLSIGYRSDTAKESFHFKVRVTKDGDLKLVPHSVETDK